MQISREKCVNTINCLFAIKKMEKEVQHLVKMHNGLREKHKKLIYDYDGLINVHAND